MGKVINWPQIMSISKKHGVSAAKKSQGITLKYISSITHVGSIFQDPSRFRMRTDWTSKLKGNQWENWQKSTQYHFWKYYGIMSQV